MTPHEGSLLPDRDWDKLQQIADQFAAARLPGPVDDWLPFVPSTDDPLHRPVLLELIKIDLGIAWRAGSGPLVESYAARFAELDPMPVDLVVEEYRVRQQFGDKPGIETYRPRFSNTFAEFEARARQLPAAQSQAAVAATTKKAVPIAPPAAPIFPEGYTPLEMIGRGCFGEVWRAEAPGGIEVAIKVVTDPIDQEGAQREQQALELIKKLQHPALLSTLAFWVLGNRLVIAMELADGSLRHRLRECQKQGLTGIPAEELLSYFRDAAVGLDYLHWQGVLHRDIKPDNILLKKGYAKVADFGLARAQNRSMMSMSFAGTPAFMAPEIYAGKGGKASDLYSLAFTYAELRLGRRPLEGDDLYTVMKNTLEQEPNLGTLPVAEQAVLRKALAKKPEERFESCEDFVDALEMAMSPDGRAGSQVGSTADTERSIVRGPRDGRRLSPSATLQPSEIQSAVPTPPVQSEGTLIGTIEPKAKPNVVWKPGAPPKAPSSGMKTILLGLAGLGVVAAAIAAAVMFWPSSHETTTTATATKPETSQTKPTETSTTQQVVEKAAFLPPRFQAPSEAKLRDYRGKKYYERILYPLKDRSAATFVLILPLTNDDPPPFYMMENKVWNAFYRELTAATGPDRLPVMNVTFAQAESFAKSLGGMLPTGRQWDYAAGITRRDSRAGPALGDRIAINRETPLAVGGAVDDISPLQIRDMAGNGREFTRDRLTSEDGESLVVLRGRNFKYRTPLTYDILTSEKDSKNTQTQRVAKASPYTGFRVVIEVVE